jgi:hypothetical protein
MMKHAACRIAGMRIATGHDIPVRVRRISDALTAGRVGTSLLVTKLEG